MRIKKLELIGFKSFKDRTVIQFDTGITGIVGPNGCGKSNIVDALLWVMGEMSAKHLRGSSMEDVIFAGSEGYSPMGLAEVSLVLENDGGPFPVKYSNFSEVMVTRRLHRNGESEYFVNKEPARLKDIQEIFMDTGAGAKGFSIIAQGTIGQMITAKPEDRKNLIEEAAGITKFKARKKESQRKLQATDQNLVRLQDITGELKRQIDSLQRQAQRAERYRNLKTQIEDLDLWLASVQYKELNDKAEAAQKIFDEVTEFEVTGESDLLQMQSDLEQLRLVTLEKEKEVENLQNLHFALQTEAQKKEMSLQGLKFEIEQGRRNEQMTGTILEEQKARQELLSRDQAELSARVQELKIAVTEIQTEFSIKNETFQNSQSRISEVDQDLTAHRRELFAVGQTLSAVEAKIAALESQTEDLQSRLENDQTVYAELSQKLTDFESRKIRIHNELEQGRQMALELSSDVDAFEANKRILNGQVEEKRSEIETFKTELNEVTGRLYGLENLQNNFEGFDEGVKKVMLWQKSKAEAEVHADGSVSAGSTANASTYFRPVSEVVEVPADYEIAMEAALGTRLQTLLASDNSASVEAVQYLKDNKSGRSSFYSYDETSDAVRAKSDAIPSGEGVRSLLKDVVKSDEAFLPSVSMLLSQVAVVDSIGKALELRPEFPGWTFVTLDGDTLTADGILTGGSSESAESGVLKRRREIKELTQKKNEWAGKLALAQQSLKKIEASLANVMNDFEGAQKRRIEQDMRVTELKKDLERADNELNHAKHAVERQEREVQKTQLQIQTLEEKVGELQAHCEESRTKKFELDSVIADLDQELNTNRNGIGGLQEEVMNLKVRLATESQDLEGNERQLAGVERSLGDLNHQLSRMSDEQSKNSTSLTENQYRLELEKIELEKLIVSVEETKERLSMSRDQYEVQHENSRDLEERVNTLQKTRNDLQMKMNGAKLQLEQARMKEQYLIDQVRERYIIELADVVSRYDGREGDTVAAEKDLKDLKERISKIGDVNLSAIEEYEETSKRYEFLTQQQNDLIEAKDQLRKVIDRINKICSKRFKDTFDLVNERFTRVFPVLFGGGEAHLELHENPETQEMGIEIFAKPPGKKMQSVTLMSGGEKALTAVALVFAIFLVKPSPYCLLDEVDAPLDDANVFRFNDLVREMSKRSQIIVVTHNKYTMEVASKLYGVTMQERGVSTMVSVNLAEING